MNERDRLEEVRPDNLGDHPAVESLPLKTLAESLRTAYGVAITVEVSAGLLYLTIGRKEAVIDRAGDLAGEANYSAVVEVMT
jgi:hypothetical protein